MANPQRSKTDRKEERGGKTPVQRRCRRQDRDEPGGVAEKCCDRRREMLKKFETLSGFAVNPLCTPRLHLKRIIASVTEIAGGAAR